MISKERLDHITEMESIYDELEADVDNLEIAIESAEDNPTPLTINNALRIHNNLQPKLNSLMEYYFSDDWKNDYEADAKGEIPKDLKRGVLSQDGIFNLLEIINELSEILDDLGNDND